MTQDELKALEGAAVKATPGPWAYLVTGFGEAFYLVCTDTPGRLTPICTATIGEPNSEANAAYIALANPSAVLSLLADLRSAQEERDLFKRNRDMWKGQCERQAEQSRETTCTLTRIYRLVRSDGQRTFDECIKDLGLIDDAARAALHLEGAGE